jgi:hypothetical protein
MKISGFIVLALLAILSVAMIPAQSRKLNPRLLASVGPSVQVGPIVLDKVKHDVSPAVRDLKVLTMSGAADSNDEDRTELRPQNSLPENLASSSVDSVLQQSAAQLVATTSGVSFEAQAASASAGSWGQPDANGAAGATQYVQWVNVSFAVYEKSTGALIKGPVLGNALWAGFGGPCETNNNGDPIAQYDKAAGRWVLTQRAAPSGGPYFQCVAVSTTSDATGTFYRYAFPLPHDFPDYPKMSVWPDAYYLSIDMETVSPFSHVGPYICALERNSMLTGAAATAQCFQLGSNYLSLLPSDLDGSTPPPTGSPNYIVCLGTNALNLWRFHVDFSTPSNTTLTGPTSISVAAFNNSCSNQACVSQPGTSEQLTTWTDRLMYRLAYRNFGSHESMVVNHSVIAGSSIGVRWYEIRSPGNNPIIFQQGTYEPDSNSRWMGSIAMDKAGDIALGYSHSSSSSYPSIFYTGRVPNDPAGTLEGEKTVISGTGVQPSVNNWGDYTSMSIDPVDDCTFWYTNQYLQSNGSTNWETNVSSFKFSNCTSTTTSSSFTHVQGAVGYKPSSSPDTITLGANPTLGNLVCVGITTLGSAITAVSVKDSNNNAYTITPNSPSALQSGAGQVWMAYLLSAPSNASKTITISYTGSVSVGAWADEFSGGPFSFDKDVSAANSVAGTTVNTPTLATAASGELLYAAAGVNGDISAPTAGETLGSWTGAGGAITAGNMSEYDLSASGTVAVQFTSSPSTWAAMAMAFYASSVSVQPAYREDKYVSFLDSKPSSKR